MQGERGGGEHKGYHSGMERLDQDFIRSKQDSREGGE